ncbi:MAG: nuclear transport factor 2 family protein [Sphingobium sp.]
MLTDRRLYCRALAIIAGLTCAASVSAAPAVIAGGALDPAYSDADIYLGDPPTPKVPAGPACRAAKAYVDYHQAGHFAQVPSLFAPDAILMEPSRLNVRGTAGITQFYAKAIGALKPEIAAVIYLGDATDCMVELAVRQVIDGKPRWRLASMDHFTVDGSGRIIRMVAFQRPSKMGLKPPHMDK